MPQLQNQVQDNVQVARSLPAIQADQSPANLRGGAYGEIIAELRSPKSHGLADEGSYFSLMGTPGTAIAIGATVTANTDTTPALMVFNNAPAGSRKRVYLDWLRLLVGAAGTAGTALRWAIKIDAIANRYTSGGTILTLANPNGDDPSVQPVSAIFGAITAAAATSFQRQVDAGMFRPVIPVAADKYVLQFGGHEQALNGLISTGTTQANVVENSLPVIIGPQQVAVLVLWEPSMSAGTTFEPVIAGWCR